MRPQLLFTFTYLDKLPVSIGDIYKAYSVDDVANMKCYYYIQAPNSVVCIYNVSTNERRLGNTISINRKKETNTYYSINAINSLIRILNNGVLDKTFIIEWNNYKDMMLLADGQTNYKTIEIRELSY